MLLQTLTMKKFILAALFGVIILSGAFRDVKASEQQEKIANNEQVGESITIEQLESLGAFPEKYDSMSHLGRLDWLNSRLKQAQTPPEIYNYKRAKAFEHFSQYQNQETTGICQENPPLSFDLGYRYLCILVSDVPYETRISQFLKLHQDAMDADNKGIAAQALVSLGWYQSGNGDIDLAFRSYNEALSLGEHLNFYELNDAMANTATLYIIHGDKGYVQRGISLHRETIEKLQQKIKDDPDSAQYVKSSITIARFNIGVAYALHLYDYEKALKWFRLVNDSDPAVPHLKMSSLIFTALSAIELGQFIDKSVH